MNFSFSIVGMSEWFRWCVQNAFKFAVDTSARQMKACQYGFFGGWKNLACHSLRDRLRYLKVIDAPERRIAGGVLRDLCYRPELVAAIVLLSPKSVHMSLPFRTSMPDLQESASL